MGSITNRIKLLGPGLITASAAIGTSHFIQSTRAGGYFGFELLLLVIAVNLLKYPFIEFGFRYTAATQENLLMGYKRLSNKIFYLFLAANIVATIGGIAAVAYLCAGILKSVLHINLDVKLVTILVMLGCWITISFGHYRYLDSLIKVFMVILLITTLTTVILAFGNYSHLEMDPFYRDSPWQMAHIPFIIALMGWMPGPIELSMWHSLWLEARNREKNTLSFHQAHFDFNVGYVLMVITATLFIALGALVIHPSNQAISTDGVIFGTQFIANYTGLIGNWSEIIIALAIVVAIFSTTIALIDIYPRTLTQGWMIIRGIKDNSYKRQIHSLFMLFFCLLSLITIHFFVDSFTALIDTVTIIAFLSTPIFAYMNYKLIYSDLLPNQYKPPLWIKLLSWIGFIYIVAFIGLFAFSRLAI